MAGWFDDELRALRTAARREARAAAARGKPPCTVKRTHMPRQREYVAKCKEKKRAWRRRRVRALERLCDDEQGAYWSTVDKIIGIAQAKEIPVSIEKLARHFQAAVFDPSVANVCGDEDKVSGDISTLKEAIDDGRYFTRGDIKAALRKVGKNKAGGADGMPSRIICMLRDSGAFIDSIYGMFVHYVHVGFWPSEWNEILITPVPKPGKPPLNYNSYRPIHLIAVLAKVFASVVEARLSGWITRSEEQFGFSAGYGTRDNVLIAASVIEKYADVGVHCAFVAFRAAFDSVDRHKLIVRLKELGVREEVVNTIAAMYTRVAATVKGTQARFVENKGVKQGDPLGPRLFNIFIKNLPELLHVDGMTDMVLLGQRVIRCLLYADDLLLFSTSAAGLQRAWQLDALKRYCDEWGLEVNVPKTEYMYAKKGDRTGAGKLRYGCVELVECAQFK